jgi:hypothetical protein
MKMTGLAAGTLLAVAAFGFPAPSQAQVLGDVLGGGDPRASRDDRYGYADTYRIGYDKGFQDGLDHGVKGRSRGNDLIHDGRYRKGDAGYKKSYGPRQDYIAGYRDGYEQAVRRGSRTAEDDARARRGGRDGWRRDPSDRDDPYGYGRDGRYGRDRDGSAGTEADPRDGLYGDGRGDPYGRGDGYDDDVVYEEPPGRW